MRVSTTRSCVLSPTGLRLTGAALVASLLGRIRARHVETAERIGESEAELLGVPLETT